MDDNEQPIIEENAVGPARDEGVHLEVNPEDTVPFHPQPVFVSLGLKREVFVEQFGGSVTTSAPPIDLTTEAGQLMAFEALGFHPDPAPVGYELNRPLSRAAKKFRDANPPPPGTIKRLGKVGKVQGPITDPTTLQPLQLRLREAGIPFSVPPIDLTTEAGQLMAFEALGFHPDPAPVGYELNRPLSRAAKKFRDANPPPPSPPGTPKRLGKAAQGPITDPTTLQPLQLRLRETGIPFTLGGISVPMELRPQLFLIEHYQLSSFRGDLARDDMIGSISLSPRTSVSYKLIVKKKTSQRNELTSTVLDSQDQEATSNFNEQVKETADAKFGRNNYNYGFDANFHGEGSIGLGQASADAEVHARGSTNEVREDFAQSTASAIDSQTSRVNRARQERMVTGSIDTEKDEETESVIEKTAHNPTALPVNIGIFQVKEEFVALLSLVDVEIGFRNGNPNQNRTVSLRQVDELLDTVVERPEDRTSIAKSIKSVLDGVIDYQNDVRSILKVDPSSTFGFSVDRQLESAYPLKRSDGAVRRNLSVPGIVIRDYRRFLRKPTVTVELSIT